MSAATMMDTEAMKAIDLSRERGWPHTIDGVRIAEGMMVHDRNGDSGPIELVDTEPSDEPDLTFNPHGTITLGGRYMIVHCMGGRSAWWNLIAGPVPEPDPIADMREAIANMPAHSFGDSGDEHREGAD